MNKPAREIFIESILPVNQDSDSLQFEMISIDSDGQKYRSRFCVRNHNVGLFNLAINKIRPSRVSSGKGAVSHTTPKDPVHLSGRVPNNSGGQSCP